MDKSQHHKEEIEGIIRNGVEYSAEKILQGGRNLVALVSLSNQTKTVFKKFKTPHLFNRIVYRFFRKSKAQRSFEYATRLTELNIGTPKPLHFVEEFDWIGLTSSYYVSEYQPSDLTYRELTTDFSIEDHEEILKAFTRFTYELHEKNVHFLDHSPGNTLIERANRGYNFHLVDLNRMNFEPLSFEQRIRNFAKLTIHKAMIKTMSDEYAKCGNYDKEEVFELMWKHTREFQHKYYKKIRLKKFFFFWKKKYKSMTSTSPI
ncbi:lipopolysaccharide kinase InaA family protein [Gangjinia marincola]|uniref:Lipopolysaccharide kinase InaA family protein n=1 Tax=Gangjinia marincola TaxID=578463 RepID=A0ABN1MGC6_9FLAO